MAVSGFLRVGLVGDRSSLLPRATPATLTLHEARPRRFRPQVQAAVLYAPPATARLDLLKDAEERWERAESGQWGETSVAFTPLEFEEALEKFDFDFEIGDQVKGVVFRAENAGALIDIGAKAAAVLPLSEASVFKLRSFEEAGLLPGVQEVFAIVREDDAHDRFVLSLRKLQQDCAWERCRQLLADDGVARARVLALNRGGLLALVDGLRAFIPLSQIGLSCPREDLVGKSIPCKFMEVDEERTRLVLSNRKAVAAQQAQGLQVGDVVVGKVQALKPYGAFIEMGGVSGLLHISQISHDRVTNVETVLKEGDELKVMVLSFDTERGRVSLSTKKLEPSPGDMIRNPQLVFEKAEEMAKNFRERVAAAEAAARAEEARLQREGLAFGLNDLAGDNPYPSPFASAF